jgi:hypothetical protein
MYGTAAQVPRGDSVNCELSSIIWLNHFAYYGDNDVLTKTF